MRFISEAESSALVTRELAFAAAETALTAAAGDGVVFPAVIGHGADPANRFSVKSGVAAGAAGLKVGSYWPGNAAQGLPRHSSIVLLFDEATGRIDTVIEASRANAFRTAAANAVAATALARPDSRVLAVFGAGHQAFYEATALAAVRPVERVLVVARSPASAASLVARLADAGIAAEAAKAQAACAAADMIVTVTPSRAPLFEADWVRAGTYIAAMGADGPGKQELPPALLRRASLFCDLPRQSVALGEFQWVAAEAAAGAVEVTAIGSVLTGAHPGRRSPGEICVFDSSGIALQDIAMARSLVEAQARA
jgi:ornithine cyclodeaminase